MSSSKDSVQRRELASLTQEEVGFVLCNLGLSKHVGSFARFGVDGIVLAALKSEKDLEGELGMSSHVQRINLISHVKDFVDKKGVPVHLLSEVQGGERTRALSTLNVDEVGTLLSAIELPGIIGKFTEARVDGSMLSEINEDDLKKELKVDSRLQRSKLIKKVEDFKINGVPSNLVGEEGEDEAKRDGVDDYDDLEDDEDDDYAKRK
mmetsp:Transcript_20304/g.40625  ORF Transcript_20304/g.40625 Transcript_20304/m.40625 type:complete len:207 (-) Transcript_20304:3-623(-)